MLVLELATPGDAIAFRQLDVTGDGRLGVLDKTDQIAVANVGLNDDIALGILAVNLHRATNSLQLGDAGQRHAAAIRQRQAQGSEIGRG